MIVVDNFPFDGSLDDINPEDIDNITVLKDAAASSIWGVKAGNGVLVITTKRGKLNQRLTIDVGTNVNVGGKPKLFSEQIVSSSDFIEMETFLFDQGFYASQINDTRKPPLSPVVHLLNQYKRNEIDKSELEKRLDVLRNRDVRNDFLDHVYRNPFESNTSLNMRGGGDKTTYSFSLGYANNQYNMPMNSRERLTARFNQMYKPFRNISVSVDFAYTYLTTAQYNSSNMIGYDQMLVNGKKLYPYAQLYDSANGNSVLYTDYDRSFIEENQSKVARDWSFRPLDEIDNRGSMSQRDQVIAGLSLDYQLVQGLRFSMNTQFNRALTESTSYYEEDSYFVRNLFNRFTYVDNSNVEYNVPEGGISDKENAKLWGYALRPQLNADLMFGGSHSLTGVLGGEIRESNGRSYQGRNYGVYEGRNLYTLVDFTSTKRMFPVLGSKAYIPNRIGFSNTSNRFVSLYSNLNYSFKQRYFLSLSARNDASNIFGVDIKNKWSPLWSIGGGWELSGEPFFKSDLFNYLKLRTSYGYSGNVDTRVPAELVLQRVSYLDFYTNLPFNSIVSLQNPGLRWEKIRTFNIAADLRMFDNKLSVSVDYYRKKSMDLLGSSMVDPTLGVSSVTMNSAQLMGQGVDVNISANIKNNTWGWNGSLLAGYNKTILDKYLAMPQSVTSNAITAANFVGKEYKVLTSLRWHGLAEDNGAPIGYIGDKPSTAYLDILRNTPFDDLVYHGASTPRTNLLLRNILKYKSWELGFTLSGQFFYFFRKSSIDYGQFFSRWRGHADFANRWKEPGDEKTTSVPAFNYPVDTNREGFYGLSEVLVRRGDHLRFQDIRVSYRTTINNKKVGLRNVELFMMASNLGLVWTKNPEGIDPVYDSGIGPSMTVTAGLKIGL